LRCTRVVAYFNLFQITFVYLLQALCDAERERIAVEERFARLQVDRDAITAEMERIRREMTSLHDNDLEVIAGLREELTRAKSSYQAEM
jgi:hypothetical protein